MAKTKVASLNNILATRAKMVFPHRVDFDFIGYQQLPIMKQWCEDNCRGIWRCESFHALYFQFENDYDATMFMLRWGTAPGNKLR
jgi:hypothetical protein